MKSIKILILSVLSLAVLASCEDPAPTDYTPDYFVEAYLIVGDPIQNIRVMVSQPLAGEFEYENQLIRDADVVVREVDGESFLLTTKMTGDSGYYYDGEYTIKPETAYELEITLKDGTAITGRTETPKTFDWVKRSPEPLQYPKDTINLEGTDEISWAPVEDRDFYLIQVIPLDTLGYGKYLDPPTDEKNRRVESPLKNDDDYEERSITPLIANTKSSIVWLAFNWYGLQGVNVYCPDDNFLRWYLQNSQSFQINPLLSSVEGATGVFGSASIIRDTTFLIKNQP